MKEKESDLKRNRRPTLRLNDSEIEEFYSVLETTGLKNYTYAIKKIVYEHKDLKLVNAQYQETLKSLVEQQKELIKQINKLNATIEDQSSLIYTLANRKG